MPRRVLLAFAIAAPFALVVGGSARLASASGTALGAAVARVAALLPGPGHGLLAARLPPEADVEPGEAASATAFDFPDPDAAPAPAKGDKKKPTPPAPRPTRGIRVSAATVLRLARRGVLPSGVAVAADGYRPAGLALHGVAALGVGLQDGDVLTEVAGAPASSSGAVVGAIVALRARHAPAVSGRVYRGSTAIALFVEMPYPR
jgi:S1-C subfamily serine protease